MKFEPGLSRGKMILKDELIGVALCLFPATALAVLYLVCNMGPWVSISQQLACHAQRTLVNYLLGRYAHSLLVSGIYTPQGYIYATNACIS
jgi:hypothetical protein